jgi:hypothetical protein
VTAFILGARFVQFVPHAFQPACQAAAFSSIDPGCFARRAIQHGFGIVAAFC